MKKYFVFIILVFFQFSCTTPTIFNVSKVGDEPEKYLERVVYVLPQTLIHVTAELEKETYIPGPYRFFTEKYLGMKEYIQEPGFSYRLLNIDVEAFTEPDPEHFYSINITRGTMDWGRYLQMSSYGLVLDPSAGKAHDYSDHSGNDFPETFHFTDLSVKRNLAEITDTIYKTIISDSSYVRVPVLRKHREAKTLEQKAEEAANFIIKIRKRRFKLLAGQYEIFPEGQALAISVEELDKLEREYLELFLGKRIKQQFQQSFVVTPQTGLTPQSITIARFSPLTGILGADKNEGNEIIIRIEPAGKLGLISTSLRDARDLSGSNKLFYRIPDIAEINVSIMDDVLCQKRIPVYQLGEVVSYPVGGQ